MPGLTRQPLELWRARSRFCFGLTRQRAPEEGSITGRPHCAASGLYSEGSPVDTIRERSRIKSVAMGGKTTRFGPVTVRRS